MRRKWERILAVLLAVVMMLPMNSMTLLAQEPDGTTLLVGEESLTSDDVIVDDGENADVSGSDSSESTGDNSFVLEDITVVETSASSEYEEETETESETETETGIGANAGIEAGKDSSTGSEENAETDSGTEIKTGEESETAAIQTEPETGVAEESETSDLSETDFAEALDETASAGETGLEELEILAESETDLSVIAEIETEIESESETEDGILLALEESDDPMLASVEAEDLEGEGTSDSPYLISTEGQLVTVAEMSSTSGYYFQLQNDIALTAVWSPIGTSTSLAFSGDFDGQGYTISNLSITESAAGNALFGYNAGTIHDLTVSGTVTGANYTALVVGYNTGTVTSVTASGTVTSTGQAGLLVGYNTGTVESCSSSGSVESTGDHGGLVGYNASGAVITESTSSATITGNGNAGGLSGSNYGTIQYSGATGKVTGGSNNSGGLVGYCQDGTISNCYARGAVTGSGNTGGLVGYLRGYSGKASILYSYASGTANTESGAGLVGARATYYSSSSTVVRFSYFNQANTGNRYGIPASTTQLKTQSTYSGWDFTNIWTMSSTYPEISLSGSTTELQVSGDGSESNPFIITTEEELIALAADQSPFSLSGSNYYQLGADIELTTYNWTAIGGNGYSNFEGVFDGNGYTISGLSISGQSESYEGLFGYSTGTIKNLTVSGSVEATGYAGLVVGYNGGTVENCSSSGSVESTSDVGGLVGYNASGAVITESISSAAVSGTGYTGGLSGSNYGTVQYSGATGTVAGGSSNTGGLIGYSQDSTISNCYARGAVTGSGNTGGLVGYLRGYSGTSSVLYSYASGTVNTSSGAGLVGARGTYYSGSSTVVRFSYFNSANTGNRYGIPATITQLKTQSTYSGWDFTNIWTMSSTYPEISLSGETSTLTVTGDGSEESPFIITTEEQLIALAADQSPMSLTGKYYYQLGADIELTTYNWTAIGGNGYSNFEGVFDGNGYTISGLSISGQSESYEGLFGYSTGTIKNLTVSGSVEATGYAGLVVGYNGGTVENCSSSGSVESTSDVGGLVGYNASGAVITESISSAAVSGIGYTGGLSGSNYGTVQYSGATGTVAGGSSNTGGLIGYSQDSTISNCYARGVVTGSGNTGGLVGYLRGYSGTSSVLYSYASGTVNTSSGAGLVGARGTYYSGSSTVVRFSYFKSTNTGNRYGIPATLAQLKDQSTYSGWDFEHIWTMGTLYPEISLNGTAEAVEVSGDGTEEDPYIITTEEQLIALAAAELPLSGKYYYRLDADIALTTYNWTPIGGNGYDNFEGVFDGNGHTISGLNISGQGDTYVIDSQ